MNSLPIEITSRKHALLALALLLIVIPNSFILGSSFQLFAPAGWVDAGMYLGYFLDLPGKISDFGPNYHSMRLPFTLVGYILHHVFSDEFANYVRILLFNSIAITSVYFLVSPKLGSVAGIFTALWLAFNPLWIAAIGRLYVDGPAMAYVFAALACWANRDLGSKRTALTWLSGFLGGLAFFTHQISFFPLAIAALTIAVANGTTWKAFIRDGAWTVLGAASAMILFGLISLVVGGPFLFFLSDQLAVARAFNGFGADYRRSFLEWFPVSYRFAAALMIGAVGLGIVYTKQGRHSTLLIAGIATLLGIALLFSFWDYVIGGTMLQSLYYSSYLLIGEVLVIASMCGLLFGADEKPKLRIIGPWLLLLISVGWIATALAATWWHVNAIVGTTLTWVGITIIFGTALTLFIWRQSKLSIIAMLAGAVICGALDENARVSFKNPKAVSSEATYNTSLQVYNLINASVPPSHRVFFAYDNAELTDLEDLRRRGGIYSLYFRETVLRLSLWDSISALWQWDRSLLTASAPAIVSFKAKSLHQHKQASVVLFCVKQVRCKDTIKAIRDLGFTAQERVQSPILAGDYAPFNLVIVDVSPKPQ